jgi:hypothetical protein
MTRIWLSRLIRSHGSKSCLPRRWKRRELDGSRNTAAQILPLINLAYALQERRTRRRTKEFEAAARVERYQVLVCNHEGHRAGLVVERIVEIVEDSAEVQYPASRAGVLYSAVIQGRVTEMIDVPAILQTAHLSAFVWEGRMLPAVVCICVPFCCIGAKRKEFSGELSGGREDGFVLPDESVLA